MPNNTSEKNLWRSCGVLEFGVFMHIDGLNIEGFCHIKNLKRSPYYVHDATAHSLTSANKNNIYAL